MKRGNKVGWIIVGVLVTIGVCCIITGAILGVDREKLNDNLRLGPIQIGSLDIDLDGVEKAAEDIADADFSSGSAEVSVGDEYSFADDVQTHSFSKINSLEAEVKYGTLKIQKTDKDLIIVHAQNIDAGDFSVKESGGELNIIDKSIKKSPGESAMIIIEIPENHRFNEADIHVSAGKMEIDDLKADELQAEVKAGEMDVTGTLTANSADLNVGAGQIKVQELDAKSISLECDAGQIKAILAGAQEDYSFEGECGAGAIHFGTETYSMFDHDDEGNHHGGSRSVEAECGIGSIKLDF